MNARTEAHLAIVAAILVLGSAMLDPRISVVVALIALIALSVLYWRRPARR